MTAKPDLKWTLVPYTVHGSGLNVGVADGHVSPGSTSMPIDRHDPNGLAGYDHLRGLHKFGNNDNSAGATIWRVGSYSVRHRQTRDPRTSYPRVREEQTLHPVYQLHGESSGGRECATQDPTYGSVSEPLSAVR